MQGSYFKINLHNLCETELKSHPERDRFLVRLNQLNLSEKEEKFIVTIFPVDVNNFGACLDVWEKMVPLARGQARQDAYWLDNVELMQVEFSDKNLNDPLFFAMILRSAYVWYHHDFPKLGTVLIEQFFLYSDGSFLFEKINEPFDLYYLRIVMLMHEKYLAWCKTARQAAFFQSQWLIYFVSIGLDLNEMTKDIITFNYLIPTRIDNSLFIASWIIENPTIIGKTDIGKESNLSFWIERLRLTLGDKFDGIKFVEFFSDREFWDNCSVEEKMVIREILQVYFNLIIDQYVYADINEDVLEKEAGLTDSKDLNTTKLDYKAIKKEIEEKFVKDETGQLKDVEGIFRALNIFAEQQSDPKINELYYYDEQEGRFKWSI